MAKKKILYIDMDDTLVDFSARVKGIAPDVREQYRGREDELPGLFALMPPMPGAIEAVRELSKLFDLYILSTAPWRNPSAWQHKVEWVHLHLGIKPGSPAYKRLILSHHKHLNQGDFLVDDLMGGQKESKFQGELIQFGTRKFSNWSKVVAYLKTQA